MIELAMHRSRFLRVVLAVQLLALGSKASGAWYEEVPYVNEDAYSFSLTYAGVGHMFSKGAKVGGHPASGKLYCILPKTEFVKIRDAGETGVVWSTFDITNENAPGYRQFFMNKGESLSLPVWLTVGGGVIGFSKKYPLVATAIGLASMATDFINAGAKGHLEKAKDVAARINGGDKFVRRCAVEMRGDKPYAHVIDSLVLSSGTKREIMLSRFIYAVKME